MNRSRRKELRRGRKAVMSWKGKPEREIEDILQEVQSVLKFGRWEPRDEPFRGFGSLPGRF